MFSDSFSICKLEKHFKSLLYIYIASVHVYIYKCIMCLHRHVRLDFWTSASKTEVQLELCQGHYVVYYMCISSLPINTYYYSELWFINVISSSLLNRLLFDLHVLIDP